MQNNISDLADAVVMTVLCSLQEVEESKVGR